MVAGGILLMITVKNWGSVDGLPSPISSSVESFSVFEFCWVVSFGVVFGFVGVDRLFVAAVNILLVAVANKLEVDILETDRLMTASLVDKRVGFDLGTDLEFGTDNRGFNIDFLIVGYLNTGNSQFGYVLIYHNSGRYVFPVATVDWLMEMDVVDFDHNYNFLDYCVIVEADKWRDYQLKSNSDDPFITRLTAWTWLVSDSADSKSLVCVTAS
ncbi:hypothetical protein G9A89_005904 [Geosiphon pyriformis]|nr:hypothetical protein G9A89_005904 [Geosiphon pyriformis]